MGEVKNQVFENREVTLKQTRSGALIQKMLKMKEHPAICMKTQTTAKKCQAIDTTFFTKMH